MAKNSRSALVVGFNTRPLTYSLNKAGYDVYAVDFFGDLDLYPNVKDCLIVIKELETTYDLLKNKYSIFLANLTIEILQKYPNIEYLIIGSGLDDAFEEREAILKEINKDQYSIKNLNNSIESIKIARNIELVHNIMSSKGYKIPLTLPYEKIKSKENVLKYPFVIKKKTGAGGINVYRMENEGSLSSFLQTQKMKGFKESEWLIQEYIEGIPVSCTIISNGEECEVISINRQIIGLKFLNPPKEFMYCGNIVPAYLFKEDEELISQISITLAKELGLKGINGFDFVLKNHNPYLMEINPRIPGSINVSETVLDLNLLNLYIQSFDGTKWEYIEKKLKSNKSKGFATKLIMFAPKEIYRDKIEQINQLENIHDKTEPKIISKGEPICTILYKDKNFSRSFFGALKIADEIKKIIG
ncbi:MAG: ATP-grasp domain-containing protein [Promethearchaeota archaeon]|nr:MAG: ATP-grasp domain-containing protein [Candidatus Lokiarchaeota archaeon]